ncbi:uncharacterized protein TRIVIDRAFT_64401 [Trichoderma virens Gv29-8]|uniref:Uncharacterized protein n=1 Tax=Hypocrea virens (strain Gv29-8 / FGSC 10586) TaxID=413071 RepID=G9NDE3_HYPVG|nr:uncharacterized protein TRIVIDRAFT_64401 [Trichoderma virens Gv29-8]EHK15710.1 hypothetical protein TRIVIDRAFT_64401 [Trichoderma virens Gv29-8]UKZ51655.1 hypothetical protein TrVGV298_005416 [Trichoderma virens]
MGDGWTSYPHELLVCLSEGPAGQGLKASWTLGLGLLGTMTPKKVPCFQYQYWHPHENVGSRSAMREPCPRPCPSPADGHVFTRTAFRVMSSAGAKRTSESCQGCSPSPANGPKGLNRIGDWQHIWTKETADQDPGTRADGVVFISRKAWVSAVAIQYRTVDCQQPSRGGEARVHASTLARERAATETLVAAKGAKPWQVILQGFQRSSEKRRRLPQTPSTSTSTRAEREREQASGRGRGTNRTVAPSLRKDQSLSTDHLSIEIGSLAQVACRASRAWATRNNQSHARGLRCGDKAALWTDLSEERSTAPSQFSLASGRCG